jgi:regulator of sigma E protease
VECQLGGGDDKEIELKVDSNGQEKVIRLPIKESQLGIQAVDGVEKSMRCVVTGTLPDSSAEEAGLKADDVILQFNGMPVAGAQHFIHLTEQNGEKAVSLVVERAGETLNVSVTPRFNSAYQKPMIGVIFKPQDTYLTVWMMYKRPWDQIKSDASGIVRILKALMTPRESKQAAKGLGGPLLIFMALWAAIKISFLNAVGFVRFLNVNLAILNLLPIPVLDGGHIVFSLWEGITRRRVHPTVVNVLVNVFATLLIGVMILISYRDVLRLKVIRGWGQKNDAGELATNAAPVAVEKATNSQPAEVEQRGE